MLSGWFGYNSQSDAGIPPKEEARKSPTPDQSQSCQRMSIFTSLVEGKGEESNPDDEKVVPDPGHRSVVQSGYIELASRKHVETRDETMKEIKQLKVEKQDLEDQKYIWMQEIEAEKENNQKLKVVPDPDHRSVVQSGYIELASRKHVETRDETMKEIKQLKVEKQDLEDQKYIWMQEIEAEKENNQKLKSEVTRLQAAVKFWKMKQSRTSELETLKKQIIVQKQESELRELHLTSRLEEMMSRNEKAQREADEQCNHLRGEIDTLRVKLNEALRMYEEQKQQHKAAVENLEEVFKHQQIVQYKLALAEGENCRKQEIIAHLEDEKENLVRDKQEIERRYEEIKTQWVVERREIQLTGPELGKGSWGTVSVATFRGARVAAKCMHNQIISDYNIDLLKREMNMAAKIRHPNLLQFIGATQSGELIILMELMPTNLRKELESRPKHLLPFKQVTSICADVARALNYLHLMQPQLLIHRDISSANILLQPLPNDSWKAKISDYGTVQLLKDLRTVGPGSPTYAAPEADNPRMQSPKMDIFSFGVLLLEMLTGKFPACEERARQLRKISCHPLNTLVQKCLREDRNERPSASDIIQILSTHDVDLDTEPGSEERVKRSTPASAGIVNKRQNPGLVSSYLRGVEILQELTLEVTDSPQSVHWGQYGMKLSIPSKSLPSNIKSCTLSIKVSLSGQYQFPADMELVSPVFWISCKPHCTFACLLSLEIEHCALPENYKHLSMAKALCTQKDLPYKFEILPGGIFNQYSSYGIIALESFSGWGVLQSWFNPRLYWFDVFYIPFGSVWDIHFAITWYSSAHIKNVKDYYATKNALSGNLEQSLSFQENSVTLDIPEDGMILEDGWRILPASPPTISKEDVDRHSTIPRCVLKAKWTGGRDEVKSLMHKVKLKGTTKETYFRIDINTGLSSHQPRVAEPQFAQQHSPTTHLHSPPHPISHHSVLTELSTISREWRSLAIALNISPNEIECNHQSDVRLCVVKMVEKWFQLHPHQISWRTLCTALKDPLVSRPDIAMQIEKKYPP